MTWPDDYINKIICGDCLEVMKGIPDGAVDLVVTDPPYGISQKGVTHKRQPGKGHRRYDFFEGDSFPLQILENTVVPAIAKLVAILSESGVLYGWLGHRQLSPIAEILEMNGFKTRMMAWVKDVCPPAPPYTGWSSGFEVCIYGARTGRTWNQEKMIMSNVLRADSYRHGNPNKNGHPTQKPLSIIAKQVKASSNVGDIILDPFAGSGTTCVAAKQLGRKYIGIEISPDYCKIAEDRLRQEELF